MPYNKGDKPVPNYQLVKLLGRGGFGEVWKATAPGGTEAALKVINLSSGQGFKEARAIRLFKAVHHPNLVPIMAFWLKDEDGGIIDDEVADDSQRMRKQANELIIAMGLGDRSLFDRLQECQNRGMGGIPAEELLEYMDSAAKAIDFLNQPTHKLGGTGPIAIHHCDIKPQNILVVGGAAQVCDFGLARVMGENRATGTVGTAAYSPPEIITSSKPSKTSDQYSLAISYIELRTGTLPFDSKTPAGAIYAHMQGALDFTKLTPSEQIVIKKATAMDPEKRYGTCLEMVRALRKSFEKSSNTSVQVVESADELVKPDIEIVPGYKLQRLIGKGGYGEVWQAKAPGGRPVALKIIRNLAIVQGKQEFRALELIKNVEHQHLMEVQAYWLLDKQGIVIPDDVGSTPNAPQPTMLIIATKLAGKNLMERLTECQNQGQEGIPIAELIRYMAQAAQAIDHLNTPQHVHGDKKVAIQHRDVKPENILITGDHVKLCDFGLAKVLEGTEGVVHGNSAGLTLAYAAPEVFSGTISSWTDQYSLAMTYVQLRTGGLPFDTSSPYSVIHAHTQGVFDLKKLPELERGVIRRALSVKPEDRFPDCRSMVRELRRATGTGSGTSEDLYTTMPGSRSGSSIQIPSAPPPGSSRTSTPSDVRVTPSSGRTASMTPTTGMKIEPAHALVTTPPGMQRTIIPQVKKETDSNAILHETVANVLTSNPDKLMTTAHVAPSTYASSPQTETPPRQAQSWKPQAPEPKPKAKGGMLAFLFLAIAVGIGGAWGVSVLLKKPDADMTEVNAFVEQGEFAKAWDKFQAPGFEPPHKAALRNDLLTRWFRAAQAKLKRDDSQAARLAGDLLKADPDGANKQEVLKLRQDACNGIASLIRSLIAGGNLAAAIERLAPDRDILGNDGDSLRDELVDKVARLAETDPRQGGPLVQSLLSSDLGLSAEQLGRLRNLSKGDLDTRLAQGRTELSADPKKAEETFSAILKDQPDLEQTNPPAWAEAQLGLARAQGRNGKWPEIRLANIDAKLNPKFKKSKALFDGLRNWHAADPNVALVLADLDKVHRTRDGDLEPWEQDELRKVSRWAVEKADLNNINPSLVRSVMKDAREQATPDQLRLINTVDGLCMAKLPAEMGVAVPKILALLPEGEKLPRRKELFLALAGLAEQFQVEDIVPILAALDKEPDVPAEVKERTKAEAKKRWDKDLKLAQDAVLDYAAAKVSVDRGRRLAAWVPDSDDQVKAWDAILQLRNPKATAQDGAAAKKTLESLLGKPPPQLMLLCEALYDAANKKIVTDAADTLEKAKKAAPRDQVATIEGYIKDLRAGTTPEPGIAAKIAELKPKIVRKALTGDDVVKLRAAVDALKPLAKADKIASGQLDALRWIVDMADGKTREAAVEAAGKAVVSKDCPFGLEVCVALASVAVADKPSLDKISDLLGKVDKGIKEKLDKEPAHQAIMTEVVKRDLRTVTGKAENWEALAAECERANKENPWVGLCRAECWIEQNQMDKFDEAKAQIESTKEAKDVASYRHYVNGLLLNAQKEPAKAADELVAAFKTPETAKTFGCCLPRQETAIGVLESAATALKVADRKKPLDNLFATKEAADSAFAWLKKASELRQEAKKGAQDAPLQAATAIAASQKTAPDLAAVRTCGLAVPDEGLVQALGDEAPLFLLTTARALAKAEKVEDRSLALKRYVQLLSMCRELGIDPTKESILEPAVTLGESLNIRKGSPLAATMAKLHIEQGRNISNLADLIKAYEKAQQLQPEPRDLAECITQIAAATTLPKKLSEVSWADFNSQMKKAIAADPDYYGPYGWRGYFLLQRGKAANENEQKVKLLNEARADFDETIKRLDKSDVLGEKDNFLRHRCATLVLLANRESNPESRRKLLETAEQDANQALRVDKLNPSNHQALGVVLEDLAWIGAKSDYFAAAEKAFETATARNSGKSDYWVDLGRCRQKWGESEQDTKAAKTILERAISALTTALLPEKKPSAANEAEARYFLSKCYALQKSPKVVEELDKVIKLKDNPGSREYRLPALSDRAEIALDRAEAATDKAQADELKIADDCAVQIGDLDRQRTARIKGRSLAIKGQYADALKEFDAGIVNRSLPDAADINLSLARLDLLMNPRFKGAPKPPEIAAEADKVLEQAKRAHIGPELRARVFGTAGAAHVGAIQEKEDHRNQAIDCFDVAVKNTPIGHRDGWVWRFELAQQLRTVGEKDKDETKLKRAKQLAEEASTGSIPSKTQKDAIKKFIEETKAVIDGLKK